MNLPRTIDPIEFQQILWPSVKLYDKQKEMIYAVRDARETFVVAGNQLGKDFVTGYICLSFFIAPWLYFPRSYVQEVERMGRTVNGRVQPDYIVHQRRIVTTSVRDDHLDILWGEISRFYQLCALPLDEALTFTHHELRFKEETNKTTNVLCYLKGQTSATGEGMSGHHAPYTLGVGDEASGLDDEIYNQFKRWAKRMLFFGNPNPCQNFFRVQYQQGDLLVS